MHLRQKQEAVELLRGKCSDIVFLIFLRLLSFMRWFRVHLSCCLRPAEGPCLLSFCLRVADFKSAGCLTEQARLDSPSSLVWVWPLGWPLRDLLLRGHRFWVTSWSAHHWSLCGCKHKGRFCPIGLKDSTTNDQHPALKKKLPASETSYPSRCTISLPHWSSCFLSAEHTAVDLCVQSRRLKEVNHPTFHPVWGGGCSSVYMHGDFKRLNFLKLFSLY